MIGARLRKLEFRRLFRTLAFWLLNPRLLGLAILIPSLYYLITTANQLMIHQEAWGPVIAQIMLLSTSGVIIGAPLLATRAPR